MKNSIAKFFFLVGCLSIITLAYAGKVEKLKDLEKDADFKAAMSNASNLGRVRLFPGQAFWYMQERLTLAAGEVSKMGKSDCFLYIKSDGEAGRIFLVSEKAEDIWDCAGSPALSVMELARSNGKQVAIASLFLYQAPSGDKFNLAFVVDNLESCPYT